MNKHLLSTSFGKKIRLNKLTLEYLTEYKEENEFSSFNEAVFNLIPKKNKKKQKPFNIDRLLELGT